jgi:hypothetical protein
MNPTTLRQVWAAVEQTQGTVLLELNDLDLMQQLLHQIQSQYVFSALEIQAIQHYLGDRLCLIRDMAYC